MKGVPTAVTTVLALLAATTLASAGIPEGPYLQNVTTSGVTVCITSTGADMTVEYGLDATYGDSVYTDSSVDPAWDSWPVFQARIEGLLPATVYHYRVTSGGVTTDDHAFTTAVNPGDAFLFTAYGDNRAGGAAWAHETIVAGMLSEVPDFFINTGDLVLHSEILGLETAVEWLKLFHQTAPLIAQSPLFAIRGNHDDYGDFFADYMDNPTAATGSELYYSFDYGNAHFLALDSSLDVCSGPQLAFVESDLAANEGLGPLFVFFHKPPFSNGTHGGSTSAHDCWAPLFQEYGVDVVFGGHDHLYTHYGPYPTGSPVDGINGVHYIVTGGGGAPLYAVNYDEQAPIEVTESVYNYVVVQVSGDTISLTAKRHDGTVLEDFVVDAAANDGLFDRTDPLPPPGSGGPSCGTVPGGNGGNAWAAMATYLLPLFFLPWVRRRATQRVC